MTHGRLIRVVISHNHKPRVRFPTCAIVIRGLDQTVIKPEDRLIQTDVIVMLHLGISLTVTRWRKQKFFKNANDHPESFAIISSCAKLCSCWASL